MGRVGRVNGKSKVVIACAIRYDYATTSLREARVCFEMLRKKVLRP